MCSNIYMHTYVKTAYIYLFMERSQMLEYFNKIGTNWQWELLINSESSSLTNILKPIELQVVKPNLCTHLSTYLIMYSLSAQNTLNRLQQHFAKYLCC